MHMLLHDPHFFNQFNILSGLYICIRYLVHAQLVAPYIFLSMSFTVHHLDHKFPSDFSIPTRLFYLD